MKEWMNEWMSERMNEWTNSSSSSSSSSSPSSSFSAYATILVASCLTSINVLGIIWTSLVPGACDALASGVGWTI
jgi:hypothetical protein